jgi:H+/Cl- antiporter ClcA
MQLNLFLWTILAGVFFGLAALSCSRTVHFFGNLFNRLFSYPPIRPVVGGIVIALVVYLMGTTKYIGLGIPTIVDSFEHHLPTYDFLIKLLLTTFTLGAGFKGGEVTPLFFIGATLGNALAFFVPLPLALLAGIGFVAVFSGATNTPIACTVMGMELFGPEAGVFIAIACFVAFFASGRGGIYSAQPDSKLHLIKRKEG